MSEREHSAEELAAYRRIVEEGRRLGVVRPVCVCRPKREEPHACPIDPNETPFLDLLNRLDAKRRAAATTNYAQVFHTPFNADARGLRAWRWCSYCGRERGTRYTCDGCGAPSVLVQAPDLPGYPPLSLEWWRERIAHEPKGEPVFMEFEAGPFRFPGWPAWPPISE